MFYSPPTGDIVDFELNVCDVQPGSLCGVLEEFVAVGRLDNLASCYTALTVGGWFGVCGCLLCLVYTQYVLHDVCAL